MEQKRDKLWRKKQCHRVFKARLIRLAGYGHYIIDEDGNRVNNLHLFELQNNISTKFIKQQVLHVVVCSAKGIAMIG